MNQMEQELFSIISNKDYKVSIRNAGKFRFPANYRFASHSHPEIEINYITSGCCIMGVGEEIVPLKKGDCIVIHPFQKHLFMVDISKSCSISQLEYSVSLPAGLLQYITCLSCDKEFYVIHNCENLLGVLDNICRYHRGEQDDEYTQIQMDLSMMQMYTILSRQIQMLPGRHIINAGKIGEIARVIQEHLEEDINIEKLAEKFQVSSRYVRKVFAKEAGMSCTQYITMLRIAKAKEMLWNGNTAITDIAILCGFNSSQYFCRIFKKHTGMTPIEYRNIWNGTKAVINGQQNEEIQ